MLAYAGIHLLDNPYFLDSAFDYYIPSELLGRVTPGDFVMVPFWNAVDGQDGGGDYFRGSCLYKKTVKKSDLPVADEYYLEIRGANSSADAYVNGKLLAHHDGGYSTWRVNFTEVLEDENEIAIVVDNSPNETVYPQFADFTFYGGLYRDVNIIAVKKTHFDLDYFGGNGIAITVAAVLCIHLAGKRFATCDRVNHILHDA